MYPSCDFVVSFPPHKTLHLIPPSIPLDGVNYNLAPNYTVPWRKRTKAQSGCLRTYDGHTDPDSGHFGSPTHAFNYDPTVRPWYHQALTTGAGWTTPYVFAGNGATGITATAPLYDTDGSVILGATAAVSSCCPQTHNTSK